MNSKNQVQNQMCCARINHQKKINHVAKKNNFINPFEEKTVEPENQMIIMIFNLKVDSRGKNVMKILHNGKS